MPAIGIAQRDCGELHAAGCPGGMAVADAVVQAPTVRVWITLASSRTTGAIGFGWPGVGIDAVKRRARPRQVEMIGLRRGKCRTNWRATRGACGSLSRSRSKAACCAALARFIGLVGAGEMAHHQHHVDAVEGARVRGDALNLRRRHAEPRHAAVDLDRRRQACARLFGASRRHAASCVGAVQHRDQSVRGAGWLRAGRQAVEDDRFPVSRQDCRATPCPRRDARRRRCRSLRRQAPARPLPRPARRRRP